MAHVPAIQKAGMHEASRIAQAIMQREAAMAVLASAGERIDRAKADRLPPPTRTERTHNPPEDQGRRSRDARPHDGDDDTPNRHVDLTA